MRKKKIKETLDLDIQNLGQVFTPERIVELMLGLRKNSGRTLEPSCGNGAFSSRIQDCVALEIDPRLAPKGSLVQDFFAYPVTEKFETIIGNPPYVRFQDIPPETKKLLDFTHFDQRSNLYLFFIEKAIQHLTEHGELIFITPRDFFKATSARLLNQWLATQGRITHLLDLGDSRVFDSVVPNCVIWRFEKSAKGQKPTKYLAVTQKNPLSTWNPKKLPWEKRYFWEDSGYLYFTKQKYSLRLSDLAWVAVGGVSGADEIFTNKAFSNTEFVYSKTRKTGKTRKMLFLTQKDQNLIPAKLLPHRETLLRRGIRKFTLEDWWCWGREFPRNSEPRIYVNCKTRQTEPFFLHDCKNFDGSVLAIFPKNPQIDLASFCDALNQVPWDDLGFVCDGRYLFSQASLANAPLPEHFSRFL